MKDAASDSCPAPGHDVRARASEGCAAHHGPTVERSLHGHDHAGGSGHGHSHPREPGHLHPAPHTHSVTGIEGHRPRQRRALLISMALTVVMCAAEFAAGLWTGSLMLLSDAVHMLSHAVSLAVSYLAIWMAARPRSARSNYGLHRAEILGSLVNGLGLFALSGWIVWESIERFQSPTPILGREMIAVAVLGLLVNAGTAWILARSGAEDLNTRSALLHMLGDLLSSVVIVLGGVVLVFTDWTWLDPLLSMLVALVIVVWAFGLVRESTSVLLERAPRGVEPDEVLGALRDQPEVHDVHDLHVWEITSGYVCLTAHVVLQDRPLSQTDEVRRELCALLWERFRVAHVTLQLEAAA